jgi:hypothetical protein
LNVLQKRNPTELCLTSLAAEQLCQVKFDGWAGAYLMSTAAHEHIAAVLRDGLT